MDVVSGKRDGVWICTFKEVSALTSALRNAIIRIAETKKSEENKGEKMHMLLRFSHRLERVPPAGRSNRGRICFHAKNSDH